MTTSQNIQNFINSEALYRALVHQHQPLPQDIQRSLQDAANHLADKQSDAARQLREQIKQYPALETAYKNALTEWDANYTAQQRTKSLSATFDSTLPLDQLLLEQVFPSLDWVTTAKKIANSTQPHTETFWNKTDRIAVMMGGGAFLGAAIAQIPGAIIGGVLAGICGWYISFLQPNLARTR